MLPESAGNVLVIHQGAVGDLVLSLPALAGLRKFYPNARFEMAGFPHILSLIEGRYYADKVVSIDGSDWASLYLEQRDIPHRLARYLSGFDIGIIFTANPNQIFSENLQRTGIKYVFPIGTVPPNGKKVHVIDYILSSANDMGLEILHTPPRLYLRESDRLLAHDFLKRYSINEGKILAAIHPGSGGKKKVWMPQRFAEVMYELSRRMNPGFLIICGPADEPFVEPILAKTHPLNPVLIKDISLVHVASILEKCRIYIGNDSGITHMAAALARPTVALYGPTDPEIWGPRGPYVSILAPDIPCSPCNKETRNLCTSSACLEAIGVKDVLDTALEFLRV
jgi:ADP-heptose:LPS heptosyltransferase